MTQSRKIKVTNVIDGDLAKAAAKDPDAALMPQSTANVGMVPREQADPNAALMPDSPSTRTGPPGHLKHIVIDAAEFEDQRGSLHFKVTVTLADGKTSTKEQALSMHHFRGYFDSVWKEIGDTFKRIIG